MKSTIPFPVLTYTCEDLLKALMIMLEENPNNE